MEYIRFTAEMESGEGFLAFEGGYVITPEAHFEAFGEITELPEGRVLMDDGTEPYQQVDLAGFPFFPAKVRKIEPTAEDHLYLVDKQRARMLAVYNVPTMVTNVGEDLVLIGTQRPLFNTLWGGKVGAYRYEGSLVSA